MHVAASRSTPSSQSPQQQHQTFPCPDPKVSHSFSSVNTVSPSLTIQSRQSRSGSHEEQFLGSPESSEPQATSPGPSEHSQFSHLLPASCSRTRRKVVFTASAFGVLRLKRLASNNPRLLNRFGITSLRIRNTDSESFIQIPESFPHSSPPRVAAKFRPPPRATPFVLATPSTSARPVPQIVQRPAKPVATNPQPIMDNRMQATPRAPIPQIPPNEANNAEPGTSACSESPLLMNLLSSNSGQMGGGMPMQQQMNPTVMRYAHNPMQNSPMYPNHYMHPQQMGGRMPTMAPHPGMGHQIPNQIAPNSMPPGGQPMPPQPTTMAPPAPQPAEPAKKRKRQTKKQKEEQQKQLQQQPQPQVMMGQTQMHPDYYMVQQQQRVPPVNMHVPASQQQQYRMSFPQYAQYGPTSSTMMQNQQQFGHYSPQMWHSNMPPQMMAQQHPDYQMHVQQQMRNNSGQMSQNTAHYGADMKPRVPALPSYNDSVQQQQQSQQYPPQRGAPGQYIPNQPNYPPVSQQMNAAPPQTNPQNVAQQRVMYDMADNVDDLVAKISGGDSEDFDLDSIELDPMKVESNDLEQQQHAPPPQQPQHQHYYAQNMQMQQMPVSGYYESPEAQQQQMAHQQQQYHLQQQQQQQQHQLYQQQMQQQRDQKEREQLARAMGKSPNEPTSPSSVPVPEAQQRSIANTIESVVERVMGTKSDDNSPNVNATPPPPTKRQKKGAKNSAQNAPTPNTYQQQNLPPTQFAPMPMQGGYYYGQQQRMPIRPGFPGAQPNVSTPPSSTPDAMPYSQNYYNQITSNGAPNRNSSLKGIVGNGSQPQTPQTPTAAASRSFPAENGGSNGSSTVPTPVSSHRLSVDERPPSVPRGSPNYSQFNSHTDAGAPAEKLTSVVALKSNLADPQSEMYTPPSANDVASATPTSAEEPTAKTETEEFGKSVQSSAPGGKGAPVATSAAIVE